MFPPLSQLFFRITLTAVEIILSISYSYHTKLSSDHPLPFLSSNILTLPTPPLTSFLSPPLANTSMNPLTHRPLASLALTHMLRSARARMLLLRRVLIATLREDGQITPIIVLLCLLVWVLNTHSLTLHGPKKDTTHEGKGDIRSNPAS